MNALVSGFRAAYLGSAALLAAAAVLIMRFLRRHHLSGMKTQTTATTDAY